MTTYKEILKKNFFVKTEEVEERQGRDGFTRIYILTVKENSVKEMYRLIHFEFFKNDGAFHHEKNLPISEETYVKIMKTKKLNNTDKLASIYQYLLGLKK